MRLGFLTLLVGFLFTAGVGHATPTPTPSATPTVTSTPAALDVLLASLVEQRPGKSNGSIRIQGNFEIVPPESPFDATAPITVHVEDASGNLTTNEYTWTPEECRWQPAKPTRVRCVSTVGTGRHLVRFRDLQKTPNLIRFIVRFKRIPIDGPFAGPVTVTLTYGAGTTRVGVVMECEQKNPAQPGLRCRSPEFNR